jgi:hypothetical protein
MKIARDLKRRQKHEEGSDLGRTWYFVDPLEVFVLNAFWLSFAQFGKQLWGHVGVQTSGNVKKLFLLIYKIDIFVC